MNAVSLKKTTVAMEHHSQDPFNPHPVFPQWSVHGVYPYPFWGSMTRRVLRQRYLMASLENEYLKVTIAPDIGGRIWDIYDKIGRRHLANYNVGVRSYNAGFGLNYTVGGIEVNYPLAHSPTTNAKREVSFQKHPDGSAAIVISELDRIWRTRWSVVYSLRPGCSYLEQHVRIYNRTPYDTRYMYWNNCGFVLKPHTQFIFPETEAAMHGQEHSTFSWPTWRHHDLSIFKDIPPQALGLYYLNAREAYFGYYDHEGQFGLMHYADLADVPGKKYWTWGCDARKNDQYRKTHHTLNEVYGEVQSGRIVIQEHLDRVPPDTEMQWTERWFPVRQTGAFNGGGIGAALRVEVVNSSQNGSALKVSAMGSAAYPRARIIISSDGIAPIEQPFAFDPERAVERIIHIPGHAGPDQHTTVAIVDRQAGLLAKATLRHPNTRDCWKEVIETHTDIKPVGAEELFREAETKARDWGNHDLKPYYQKVLAVDPGFSPARRELGKIALGRGLYEEALEHFEAARQRDPDCLELRYLCGLALRAIGRLADARQAFEWAARYDWEMRSLARLAEMRMAEQDWPHALKHLDRIAAAAPRLTRCRCLRAICYRKLHRRAEAAAEIAEARQIDGQDPFLQLEQMFIACGNLKARPLPSAPVKVLVEQVRGEEPPLLEAALDYLSVGLFEEVEMALRIVPQPGPLADFMLAYIFEQVGRPAEALHTLRRACRQNPLYHHAWALEMIPVLRWASRRLPKEPRPLYHLGNLYMARRREKDAISLWRQAERLGEQHYLLMANIAFYEKAVDQHPRFALAYFRKADARGGDDLYVKHQIQDLLRRQGQIRKAIAYLEGQNRAVRLSPLLAHDLLSGYLEQNAFGKFDALCSKLDFDANSQIAGPHSLWVRRQIQEAILLKLQGRLTEALALLVDLRPMPEHLGLIGPDTEDDRRFYHIGCLYEKLGSLDEARRWWEKAVALPHACAYEPAGTLTAWNKRYYHALCLQKLNRRAEAESYFDAMELLAANAHLPERARELLLDLVERGRFGPQEAKDRAAAAMIEVATRVEL